MATNKRTQVIVIEMEKELNRVTPHAEAAEACAIGYKEAGSPHILTPAENYGDEFLMAGKAVPVPQSWFYASVCMTNHHLAKVNMASYLEAREDGNYAVAARIKQRFYHSCSKVVDYAEKTIAAS